MKKIIILILTIIVVQGLSRAEEVSKRYVFIPGESTLRQTGGLAGIDELFTIEGYFYVTIDFDANTAQFDYVNAIATNDGNYGPHDINEVFQMTQLVSTEVNEFSISFEDNNPPIGGIEINILMTFQGGQVCLMGTRQWPSVPDSFQYDIDAVAQDSKRYIYVDDDGPADFDNIQDAIDDTNNGDEIIVSTGIYDEYIEISGKNIVLRSTNPEDRNVVAATRIKGRGPCMSPLAPIVTFSGAESAQCRISGFTITCGGRTWAGGGIYGNGTLATIEHNMIYNNEATGGISFARYGGGLYDCDGLIQYNMIYQNLVVGPELCGCGGGLYGCDGIIRHNIVYDNIATGGVHGSSGGGLSNCQGIIENNTIFGNSADYDGGLSGCDGIIRNCIIWGNTGGQLYSVGDVTYCDIQGGWPGEGNIDADPCFADAGANDFHLQSEAGRWDADSQSWVTDSNTSECIDAGDPNSDWTAELWPHGQLINMGAYGGTPEASRSLSNVGNIADLDNDGDVDYNDLKLFTDKWPIEQVLLAEDLDRNGKVDFKDYAIFANELFNEGLGEPLMTYEITQCGGGIFAAGLDQTRFAITVEGNYIHFEDTMQANCCAAELWLEMYVGDEQIVIFEKEMGGFCFCICDNPVEAELGPFKPGTYTVEVYEDWGGFIGSTKVVIE